MSEGDGGEEQVMEGHIRWKRGMRRRAEEGGTKKKHEEEGY